jgi:hypothetical protein
MNQVKTRKTGIFSGSFNPIHIGHLIIAQNAVTQYHLDQILFIPTGALMSPVSFNEGNSVPGIAHCVVIEKN